MDKGEQQRLEKHKKQMQELQKQVHKKVAYYAQKPVVESSQLYHLVKEFFLGLLDKEYEPTYEELISELHELDHEFLFFSDHQRRRVADILQKLSEAHYSNAQFSEDQSKQLLTEIHEVVTDLTTHTDGSIDHVLQKGLRSLNKKDFDTVKQCYLEARGMVSKLDEQEQEKYRPELEELYNSLKNN